MKGWKFESHRHMLASKGISSKKYMAYNNFDNVALTNRNKVIDQEVGVLQNSVFERPSDNKRNSEWFNEMNLLTKEKELNEKDMFSNNKKKLKSQRDELIYSLNQEKFEELNLAKQKLEEQRLEDLRMGKMMTYNHIGLEKDVDAKYHHRLKEEKTRIENEYANLINKAYDADLRVEEDKIDIPVRYEPYDVQERVEKIKEFGRRRK